MTNSEQREFAETVFERTQRRERELNDALKQEYARREAAVKNMLAARYKLKARAACCCSARVNRGPLRASLEIEHVI